MTEPSAFWNDLNRDLADPETAAAYASNQAAIRGYDQEINDAVRSLSSLDPGAVVLGRRIWECAVDELGDDYFGAQLKPVSGNAEEAEASFDYLQVSDVDRPLLQLGALFWLVSETVKCSSGHVEGRSTLRFRRVDDGILEAPDV
jgi:hypothetical protein